MAMTRREASRSRTITLRELESTVRAAWSADTCDPVDLAAWHRGNPARGQCGVTALVLHDVLGGELLVAQVESAEGVRQGVHWWNRLPGGVEVDLTREQFTNGEVIGEPRTVPRPPGHPADAPSSTGCSVPGSRPRCGCPARGLRRT